VAAREVFLKRQREDCGWDLLAEGTSDLGSGGGGTSQRNGPWWLSMSSVR